MRSKELVAFIACVASVNAIGIDLVLPALGQIGRALSVGEPNHRQLIITVYIIGFGVGQLVYGPLSDRFGRRIMLLLALAGFVVASIAATAAPNLGTLLAARLLQGLFSASARVLPLAIVRDRASGREMASLMSAAQAVFFIAPMAAPALGQGLLAYGPWQIVFLTIAGYAALVFVWTASRLPETLARTARQTLDLRGIVQRFGQVLTNRKSVVYSLASALTFGGIVAFISSSQQIFVERFQVGSAFAGYFAVCAFAMSGAAIANARLVLRFGASAISRAALLSLLGIALVHSLVTALGYEGLAAFVVLQAASMACIGLCGANFGALAMAEVGHMAGTAASVQGFMTSIGAVAVGSAIGLSYDGTTMPLSIGYIAIAAIALFMTGGLARHRSSEPAG